MKGFSTAQKILEGACLAVLAGMSLLPFLFWGSLPDRIPGHYNGAGEIDRWAGKWELFLLPVFGAVLYMILSAASMALGVSARKGELPRSASAWMAAMKLAALGAFAVVAWHSARAQPLPEWHLPVTWTALGISVAGFTISSINFALRQKKK